MTEAMVTRASGRVRLNNNDMRRRIVLVAAYNVACRRGISALAWPDVADECEISTSVSTARRAFDRSLMTLRREVAGFAALQRNRKLMAEAKRLGFLQ